MLLFRLNESVYPFKRLRSKISYSERTRQRRDMQKHTTGTGKLHLSESPEKGLNILRDRAREIDAEIDIESEPGDGTRIHLQFKREADDALLQSTA